jgi:hypothetical protein
VQRLPADTVARLRALTEAELTARLGVVAQWQVEGEHFVATALTDNLGPNLGVRRKGGVVQMGLTRSEIAGVWSQARRLLAMIDAGKIAVRD